MRIQSTVLAVIAVSLACTDLTPTGLPSKLPSVSPLTAQRITTATATQTVVALTAGDIAGCNSNYADESTATVIKRFGTAPIVIPLGDNVYTDNPAGPYTCYASLASWGQFKNRTWPVVGNHECLSPGNAGYIGYFNGGADSGRAGHKDRLYYAAKYGHFLLLMLNSELGATGCDTQTLAGAKQQAAWIGATIRANPGYCQMAFIHRPWKSNDVQPKRSVALMQPIIDTLVYYGVEVFWSAHNHNLQIWKPLLANGVTQSPRGMRQFVVGTGGAGLLPLKSTMPAALERQVGNRHAVMRIEMRPPSAAQPKGGWTASAWAPGTSTKLAYASGNCH
jgi:hypothetical protein